MPETWNDLLEWFKTAAPWLAVSSVVIEISPIKINPWSWFFGVIGKMITKDIADKVDKLTRRTDELEEKFAKKYDSIEDTVKDIEYKVDEQKAINARAAIIDFGDDLIFYPERRYTKDKFDAVVQHITSYDRYCEQHPEFQNHMTETTSRLILEKYHEMMLGHTFVGDST